MSKIVLPIQCDKRIVRAVQFINSWMCLNSGVYVLPKSIRFITDVDAFHVVS